MQLQAKRAHVIAGYVWRAYEHIHRRVGANPLDSRCPVRDAERGFPDGVALEMAEIHNLSCHSFGGGVSYPNTRFLLLRKRARQNVHST